MADKMRNVLIEGTITKRESRSVEGMALIPRISLNGNLYTPREIEAADGKAVPLNWEHKMSDVLNDVDIGTATFEYDWINQQLYYKAEITNETAVELMKDKEYHVSIEAIVGEDRWICNAKPDDCFHMPSGLEFIALALTQTPGIPQATLKTAEGKTFEAISRVYIEVARRDGMKSDANTKTAKEKIPEGYVFVEALGYAVPAKLAADKAWVEKQVALAAENDSEDDIDAGAAKDTTDAADLCPEGMKRVDGECVEGDNMESKAKECGCKKTEADDDDDDKDKDTEGDYDDDDDKDKSGESKDWVPNVDRLSKRAKEHEAKLAKIEKALKAKKEYKVARIAMAADGISETDMKTIAEEGKMELLATSKYKFEIDLSKDWSDAFAKPYNYQAREGYFGTPATPPAVTKVGETINYVGADRGSALSIGQNIRVRPNGKYARSIRDLVTVREFESYGPGVNEIKEPISAPMDAQDQTEGQAADNDYGEITAHFVSLTANVVRGTPQFASYSQLEDTPQQIFGLFTEASRIEALNEEARLLVRASNTVDTTGFNTLGRWMNGAGATITSDDATGLGEITAQTLADIKQYYQEEGYETGFGAIKLACSPNQYNALYNDPELDRYINDGNAEVRRTGDLVFANGIEIIPMNAIKPIAATGGRTNAAERAFAFIPQSSFLLGIKRDMRVAILEDPIRNGYDWNWTQRKNAIALEAKSICRISTEV